LKLNININYEITHKLNLYLDSNEQHITDSIHELSSQINLKRIEQRNALKILLLNLFITPSEKVRTPRAKKSLGTKRYNPLKIGYSALRTVLDTLDKHGLVIQEIGLKDVEADISKMTTILATKKLGGWFDQYQWTKKDIDITEKELVIYRANNKSKDWLDYVDGERSLTLREELRKYNKLLNNSKIHLVDKNQSIEKEFNDLSLNRVFINHNLHSSKNIDLFSFGGRMYGPWSNLPSEQRKKIKINNERTVEIDIESSHINAMYKALTGKPYELGDPYKLEVSGFSIPRHIVKTAGTMMQFTSSTRSTVSGMQRHYFPKEVEFFKDKRSKKDIKRAEEYNQIKKIVKPSEIVKAYLNKHKEISWYYHKEKIMGHHIQYWESEIVFDIVIELTNAQIPVLTVYDSFIVQEQHKARVEYLIKNIPFNNKNVIKK